MHAGANGELADLGRTLVVVSFTTLSNQQDDFCHFRSTDIVAYPLYTLGHIVWRCYYVIPTGGPVSNDNFSRNSSRTR